MKKTMISLLLLAALLAVTACGQTASPMVTPSATPPSATATNVITPTPSAEPLQTADPTDAVSLTSTPQTTPKNTRAPTATPASTFVLNPPMQGEITQFSSREEFHWAIQESKQQAAKGEEKRIDALDEIAWYIDFKSVKKELELQEVALTSGWVGLSYGKKGDESEDQLRVQLYRPIFEYEPNYVEDFKKRIPNPIDMKINGNPAVKDIYSDGERVSNHYNWTENDMNIYLRVPAWLLEKYPEEDFFDIQIVTVPKG